MGKFSEALGDAGAAAGAGALGQVFGLITGGIQDRRQLKQQGRLQDQQIEGNKEMADYNYNKQLEMWKATNYEAQRKELEKAGLNAGLLYGMSGGGGTTVGSGAGAGVGGAQADGGAERTGMGLQMASQLALQKAQKENIEADTENKKAQTGKTGVETETAKGTQEAQIDKAKTEAQTAVEEMWLKTNERTVSDHTIKQRVEMTMQELLGQIAKNKNTDTDTRNKQAQAIISEFDAKMTEEGISTRAPWYLKMVTDLLEKVGLNPITATKEALK